MRLIATFETAAKAKKTEKPKKQVKGPSPRPYAQRVKDKLLGDQIMVFFPEDKTWYPASTRRVNLEGDKSGGLPFAQTSIIYSWRGPYADKREYVTTPTFVVANPEYKVGDRVYVHFSGDDWYESEITAIEGNTITFVCVDYREDGEYEVSNLHNIVHAERKTL